MLRSLAVLVPLILIGCTGPYSNPTVKAKESPQTPVVRVRSATIENIPEIIPATGELFAIDQATLRAKVSGRVAKLNVDLGTRVNEGDIIAELEREDYDLRLKQAEATLEQTRARMGLGPKDGDEVDPEKTSIVRQGRASLKEATLLFNNASELFKKGIVSNVDFQRAGVSLQAAEARMQGAIEEVFRTRAEILMRRQEVALARQQLTDSVIRAPFRGAITDRIATLGEYLAVNAPAAVLVRWNPLRVRLQVPERQAHKVKPGQRIDLNVEGQSGIKPGRVIRISPAIEQQNRSLLVEGEIPNEESLLRSGSFVEATIVVNPTATGFAVPFRSVISFAGVDRVLVASNGAVEQRIVRFGRRLEKDRVEILEGLKTGDKVIIEPSDKMLPGQKVQPAE